MIQTTIKIKSIDKDRITGINMEGEDKNKMIDIDMNKNVYLAMLIEMKKDNVVVDEEFKCFENRIFTISEREWFRAPKELWKPDEKTGELAPPKTFAVALRKDLEYLIG